MRPLASNPTLTLSCIILLLLLHLRPAFSLGINCRGSLECHPIVSFRHSYPFIPAFASLLINGTSPPSSPLTGGPLLRAATYHAYSSTLPNIACDTIPHAGGGFCVFLQGSVPKTGVSGEVIMQRIMDLVDHGCQECGSVPLSGDNDPDKEGILTVNWVAWTGGCDGVCTLQNSKPQVIP